MILFPTRCSLGVLAVLVAVAAGCGAPEGDRQPDDATPGHPAERIEPVDTEAMRFRHLTVETGLSQNAVFDIVQDRKGFVWMGTKDGLNRYDGREVTVNRHDPFDGSTLPSSYVTALLESADGHLWVGTREGGVARLDPATGEVVRVANSPRTEITALAEDASGDLWIGTVDAGLYRLAGAEPDAEVEAFRHDPADLASLSHDRVDALLADREGRLWVGTLAGLDRRAERGFTHFDVTAKADPEDHAPDRVTALTQSADGTIWAATPSGLNRLDDPATGQFTLLSYSPRGSLPFAWGDVRDLREGPDGGLWAATQTTLSRFDPETGTHTYTRHNPDDPESLTGNYNVSLLWDRSNVLWVGTNGYGVNLYDAKSARFGILDRPEAGASASWATFSARAIFEDRDGRVWVNANDQLYVQDEPGGDLIPFRPEGQTPPDWATPGWSMSTTSFAQDREGAIWLADGAGLHRYHPRTRQYRFYRHDPDRPESLLEPQSAEQIRGVFEDREGAIWLVTPRYLSRLEDPEAGRFRHIRHTSDVDARDGGTVFLSMHEDAQGRFWIATHTGLLRFDPRTNESTHYRTDPSNPTSLSNDRVRAVLADPAEPDRVLWIGTDGGGLNRFDVEAETFEHITTADGLPNDVVYGVLSDDDGRLWLSTNRGLARYDPRTGAVQTYDASDGLQSNEFNTASFHRGASGKLYFGGVYGVNVFDPADFEDNPFVPNVALTGLRIGDQPVAVGDSTDLLDREVWATDELHLSHHENMVTFSFAALDFSAPEKNRYAYRMGGLDADWIQAGTEGSATYTNLPPGRHMFRVRGSNNDGVWNEVGASLELVVAPPWWRSWWAYALYGLAIVGGVVLAVRYREERRRLAHEAEADRREAEALRQLDRSKSTFFANVSHEFRTPLTLTLGPLDDVISGEYGPLPDDAATQLSLARRSAGRVLGLINQILNVARLEAGSTPLRAQRVPLEAFVEAQAGVFGPLAVHRQIDVAVVPTEAPVEVWLDPEHVGTILSNVISNALKFTPGGGSVLITAEADEDEVRVSVRDSGPGIAPDDLPHVFDRFYQTDSSGDHPLGSGIGLALARELATLHGGTLTVGSTVGFGSTFTLALPLGRDHLQPDQIVERPWAPASPVLSLSETVASSFEPVASSAGREEEASDLDRTTVLVVDDHAEIRAFVRRHLERAGYRVTEATDGEDALDRVRERLPDLVVSDVMMPRLDGLGLCRVLRADPETDFLPILLLTAKAGTEDRLDGLAELCDDYLTKPFDVRELVARVDTLIALRKRLRERFAARWSSGDGSLGDGRSSSFGDGVVTMTPTQAPVLPVESADDAFVSAVRAAIRENLGDESFGVGALAESVGLSRSHLLRRTTALMDAPPSALIRSARLDQAARLLVARAGTVSEIAYAVGFKSVAHFSDAFLAHTGSRPSTYTGKLQEQ
ncbi:MAG: hybrid sensor histidine kinase/response regulator transcription factor [Rubricoccaceae bacterium]